jgi:hypothetical protein
VTVFIPIYSENQRKPAKTQSAAIAHHSPGATQSPLDSTPAPAFSSRELFLVVCL